MKLESIKTSRINLLIVLFASLLFIPFLGQVHLFDWDEINFAESAREMIVTGDYLNVRIDFNLFWEKPPLFIWMQVLSMKIFGINEFAARFPNAVVGIISLLVLFNIGRKHFDKKFGLIWVFAYVGSVLPFFYFKSGIIDPWFNLFIFLGIYFFIRYLLEDEKRVKFIIISSVSIGLGTLTKGPVALLLFLLTGFVYLVLHRFKMRITFKDILIYIFIYAIVGGFWFILQILNGNFTIIQDFIKYQIELFGSNVAGHQEPFYYHFIVLFFGVFPASIFALKSFRKGKNETSEKKLLKEFMMILFWVVLILFSIVKTKIIHYSSAAYFPLTFLAAFVIYNTEKGEFKKSKLISGIIIFLAFFYASAIFVLQYIGQHHKEIIQLGIIKDKFANANLEAITSFTGFEFLTGVFLLLGVIFALYYSKKQYLKGILILFTVNTIFINLTQSIIVPQVEKISQKAAIDFFIEHKNEKAYFTTYAMKSYAPFFYAKKMKADAISQKNMLTGKIEKPVYVMCRITKKDEFAKKYPSFKIVQNKNGYVFFKKEP